MTTFIDFCRLHGVLIDRLPPVAEVIAGIVREAEERLSALGCRSGFSPTATGSASGFP